MRIVEKRGHVPCVEAWTLPCLTLTLADRVERRCAVVSRFSFDYFPACIAPKTGSLVQPVVQGNSMVSAMGRGICQQRGEG